MLNKQRLSVVIPCKNEKDSITKTIKSIPAYVDEIIVVDNGSTDATVTMAKKTRAVVLTEKRKMNGVGYGYALLKGFGAASGDYIFTIDADGSHPANKIENVLKFMLKNELDVVSCSRLPLSSDLAISRLRKLGIYVLNIEAFLLYGIKIKDTLSGMFGIKKSALGQLKLKMGDWNLSPEIKITASTSRSLKYAEFSIAQLPRSGGESKQIVLSTGKSHFLYLIKRKFNLTRLINIPDFSVLTKLYTAIKRELA